MVLVYGFGESSSFYYISCAALIPADTAAPFQRSTGKEILLTNGSF